MGIRNWPEDPVPDDVAGCIRCELSCHKGRIIWGEGNPRANIFVLLDNPGAREDAEGNPFVCGTRDTLHKAAAEAGLTWEDLYVTYVLKCRPRKAYDKPKARDACDAHLERQLEIIRPHAVFCLGNVALQTFLRNPEAEVKSLRGSWVSGRGFPVAATYHPLAVRRRPVLYPLFAEDWRIVAERCRQRTHARGEKEYPPFVD